MVKFVAMRSKFVQNIKKITAKSKHQKRLGLLLFFLIIIGAGGLFLGISKIEKKPVISCSELSAESKKTSSQMTSSEDVQNVYQNLEENSDACDGYKKSNPEQAKLDKLQFYHDKAVSGYMLGKYDESKVDADVGLKINTELSETSKKIENHEQLVKDLERIRDGNY